MHTLVMVIVGLGILAIVYGIGILVGGHGSGRTIVRALGFFVALWLGVSGVDLYLGITSGGSSVETEVAVHLAIFLIPAAAALFLAIRASRRRSARPA